MWHLIICFMLALLSAQPVATAQEEGYQPPGDTGFTSERGGDSATDGYSPYSAYEIGTYPPGIDYAPDGYPPIRQVDRPGAVEHDLNYSFPKRDSLFPNLVPQRWADFKARLYKNHGLKLATSYQSHLLSASDVLSGKNTVAAGFVVYEAEWDVYGRGEDHQGGIIASATHAHGYTLPDQPIFLNAQTGSILPHDAAYGDLGWFCGSLFWEQWFRKDRFVVRVGQQNAIGVLDFFRYADIRTSAAMPTLSFPANSIPFGPSGFGATFKWWKKSIGEGGLYAVANVTDINSELTELDFRPIFDTGDVFAGVELGYNWKSVGPAGPELDHLHLTLFYADEASLKPFPSESGWGFKVAGEKQCNQWVGFGSYAYNNARGGGFGQTNLEHNINMGLAYDKPFGIRGEIAGATSWGKQLDGGPDQSQLEFYWKILVTPDLFVTPGMQIALDPVNNPGESAIWIPTLRFRMFY